MSKIVPYICKSIGGPFSTILMITQPLHLYIKYLLISTKHLMVVCL